MCYYHVVSDLVMFGPAAVFKDENEWYPGGYRLVSEYSEPLGFGLSDNFHWGWGVFCTKFRIGGILPEFTPKFQPLQQAHASQILSHRGS